MEVIKMPVNLRVTDASSTLSIDESWQLNNGVKGNENLGDDLLEDLDSYLEDINDRLTIARMVSDSVIKGMVNAIEQEAAERIAAKDLELVRMRESLCCNGADENGSAALQVALQAPNGKKQGPYPGIQGVLEVQDRIAESLNSLSKSAKEQFKKLKKEIEVMKVGNSIRRTSSCSDSNGVGGILLENESERWIDVDKTMNNLKITMEATYNQVSNVVYLSKASLSKWQQEQEFQGDVEAIVSIQNLQDEFEEKLWDQNALFCGIQAGKLHENFNELSSLHHELDAIFKSLPIQEIGHLPTYGYESSEDCNNAKRTDHFHRKVLNSHASSSFSLLEGLSKQEDSKTTLPENLESSQLKHMSKDELFRHFKTEMTLMKRNHESQVQQMTEEYFSLKREFFKERDPSLLLKKDKEFDILRKKISETISKFEDILVKSEKLLSLGSAESLSSLKNRLEALVSENRHLRGLLSGKKNDIKRLLSLVSDGEEKLRQHSLAETSTSKMVDDLRCNLVDAHIEALISEDVYRCILREMAGRINCDPEQFDLESAVVQEIYGIIYGEAVHNAKAATECGIEDLEMESTIMQGLCTIVFQEAFKEAEKELEILGTKYIKKNELLVSLEKKVLEVERALDLERKERKRLGEEMLSLTAAIEQKDKFGQVVALELEKKKEQSELASQEIHSLKELVSEQQMMISKSNKELIESVEKIDSYKSEIEELNQTLELAMKQSKETDDEKRLLLAVVQEKQNKLALNEATEKDNKKKLELVVVHAHGLLKAVANFESRVAQSINACGFRLQNSSYQLNPLIQKAGTMKRTGFLYKEKLKRRCSDLQKAEAEVDLLGDEVDALLSLLEKIYIALDHYSPILQHYPGIMEILKLIRRELSGEATKQV